MKHNFVYISKKDEGVEKEFKNLELLLRELQDIVRDKFTFQFRVVGSYKKNMITYDLKSNVGYDFDFNIEVNDDDENFSAKEIKLILIDGLNKIVKKYGYDYAEDSTRGQYELESIAAPDLCARQGTTYHSNPCASTRSVIIQSELELPLNCKYVPTAYAFSSLEAGDISD